jgi:hypothetical protein
MTATPGLSVHHALVLHLSVPMRGRLALDVRTALAQATSHRATRGAASDPRPLGAALSPLISSLITGSARTEGRITIGSCHTELLR